MKKLTLCLMTTMLLLAFQPNQSNASITSAHSSFVVSKHAESTEAKAILRRLYEIKALDKTNLKPSEKRNLREEVRSLKDQLSDIGGGVYLSVGAIILIVILLIILL